MIEKAQNYENEIAQEKIKSSAKTEDADKSAVKSKRGRKKVTRKNADLLIAVGMYFYCNRNMRGFVLFFCSF